MKCCHCGKEIGISETAYNIHRFENMYLKDEGWEKAHPYMLGEEEGLNELRFTEQFVYTPLCKDCAKELRDYLCDFYVYDGYEEEGEDDEV